MATQIAQVRLEKTLVLVIVSGGVGQGASGWGITPGGKLKKIPDNNPIAQRLASAALAASMGAAASPRLAEMARMAETEMADAAADLAAQFG